MIEVCQNIKKKTEEDRKKTEKDRKRQKEDRKRQNISFYIIWILYLVFGDYILSIYSVYYEDRRRQKKDRKRQKQQKR